MKISNNLVIGLKVKYAVVSFINKPYKEFNNVTKINFASNFPAIVSKNLIKVNICIHQ